MRIVDYTYPRREDKMALALGKEYVPITDPYNVPEGDVYLVPSSWWYKGKDKKAVECANAFRGAVILVDYAREMWKRKENVGRINAKYVAVSGDSTHSHIKPLKWSVPALDPSPEFERKDGKHVLVTMRNEKGKIVERLVEHLRGKKVVWKMRSKFAYMRVYYEGLLKGLDFKLVCPHNKDYNWPVPYMEMYAEEAEYHVAIGRRSVANMEMVRFGVPTCVWNGKRMVSHDLIRKAQKWYGGKPKDYCTQNLVRNLREIVGSC